MPKRSTSATILPEIDNSDKEEELIDIEQLDPSAAQPLDPPYTTLRTLSYDAPPTQHSFFARTPGLENNPFLAVPFADQPLPNGAKLKKPNNDNPYPP